MFEWDPDNGTTATTLIGKKTVERCSELNDVYIPHGPFVAVDILEVCIHYNGNLRFVTLLQIFT